MNKEYDELKEIGGTVITINAENSGRRSGKKAEA